METKVSLGRRKQSFSSDLSQNYIVHLQRRHFMHIFRFIIFISVTKRIDLCALVLTKHISFLILSSAAALCSSTVLAPVSLRPPFQYPVSSIGQLKQAWTAQSTTAEQLCWIHPHGRKKPPGIHFANVWHSVMSWSHISFDVDFLTFKISYMPKNVYKTLTKRTTKQRLL